MIAWIDWSAVFYISLGVVIGYWLALGKLYIQRWLEEEHHLQELVFAEIHEMNEYVHHVEDEGEPVDEQQAEYEEQAERVEDKAARRHERILQRWALFVAVAITAGSAIYFSNLAENKLAETKKQLEHVATQQKALDADQESFNVQIHCQQHLLSVTIKALKARGTFAEQQALVTLESSRAQKKFLDVLRDPNVSPQVRDAAYSQYLNALRRKIIATSDQLKVRTDNPFPTFLLVESCKQ